MNHHVLAQLNSEKKPVKIPEADNSPVTPSEEIVREERRRLDESSEQLRKLEEQLKKRKSTG